MKPHIKSQILNSWKEKWNNLRYNKLKNIGTEIGVKNFNHFLNRKEEIKFTRIRLGHTRLTHSFILLGEEPILCANCHISYSIKHISLG